MQKFMLAFGFAASLVISPTARADDSALQSAVEAGRWIESHTIETDAGVTWAADPEDTDAQMDHLYSGASGVVLFLTELWRATEDDRWLTLATRGGDNLIANLPDSIEQGQGGLYTGVAGIGFVLDHVFYATGEGAYRQGALHCVRLLRESAIADDAGANWGPVTDIIGGTAGIGLFLLYAHDEMDDESALALAVKAGRSLLAQAIKTEHGITWRMTPEYERLMPNFSHGTAGVAFFLAHLAEAAGDAEFLAGALKGAAHVEAIADRTDGGLRLRHHTPDVEDLFYMGWCHGPVGTSRLFDVLHLATGKDEWQALADAGATAIEASGAPETRSAGYWETVGRCCGTAGMGDFYLNRYARTGDAHDLDMARRCVEDVLGRVSRTDAGLRWVQAEHRTQPEFLVAQTGLAQGASGIGLMLLHYDAVVTGRKWTLTLPDEVR